jgi:hypothetical protein
MRGWRQLCGGILSKKELGYNQQQASVFRKLLHFFCFYANIEGVANCLKY